MARAEKKVDARISGAGKAVLYGRYSSHSQKDASIEQQFRECREYAKDMKEVLKDWTPEMMVYPE